MNHQPYQVLIIGAGQIGAFYDCPESSDILSHAHAFSLHPEFSLMGFVDADGERATRAASVWNAATFSTLEEAMTVKIPDVVCIATPDESHATFLERLLEYPVKLVFCEKPLTTDAYQAEKLIACYEASDTLLVVNYTRRFLPTIQAVRNDLAAGRWGNLLAATGYYGKGLLHNGSHLVDLLLFFGIEPELLTYGEPIFDYRLEDPSFSVQAQFKTAPVYLNAIDSRCYSIFELDLLFEQGRLQLKNGGLQLEQYHLKSNPLFPSYTILSLESIEETGLDKGMLYAADHIAACLRGNASPLCSGRDALASLRLCTPEGARF